MLNKNPGTTKSGSDGGSSIGLHAGNLQPSDWAILHHVWLYHFTFRHAVERLFFLSLIHI